VRSPCWCLNRFFVSEYLPIEGRKRSPACWTCLNPKILRADFDPGDHLHPNDAGYQAMADAVNLAILN
jgi:lysophospholipase L1-like esterase